MNFKYTRYPDRRKDKILEWFFEKIPGFLSWSILAFSFLMIFIKPFLGAIFIILFEVYWLVRLLYMTLVLILGYLAFEIERRNNWLDMCKSLSEKGLENFLKDLESRMEKDLIATFSSGVKFKDRFKYFMKYLMIRFRMLEFKKNLELKKEKLDWKDIYLIVIFPVMGEKEKILRESLRAIVKADYPLDKFIVLIAAEARAGEGYIDSVNGLVKEFKGKFRHLECIVHPDKLPGETRVKGANITYSARFIKDFLARNNIDFEKALVSIFDSDTCADKDYFSCLTYHYITDPERTRVSYQPIPIYNNNIWEAPSFSRVMEMGSSFWVMMESTKAETLVTFSSHSMSYKTLSEVGFWPVDLISDDSAIYWKSYLHYNSGYYVKPIYNTVSMNMVSESNLWKTFCAIYRQKRRWAYGVENFPILVRGFLRNRKISFFKKIRCLYRMLDSHISWATWAFIITISGWLFLFVRAKAYNLTVLSFLTPKILGVIFNLAGISLVVAMILSVSLLPKTAGKKTAWSKFKFALQWLMLPFIYPLLGALPALDAQTRLLLGIKMEFEITPK